MIIDYDRRPTATIDQKMQSLIESLTLALGEQTIEIERLKAEIANLKGGGGE